jgi:nucleoside phosphorylase
MHLAISEWARQRAQSSGVTGEPLEGMIVWIGASKIDPAMVELASLLTLVLKDLKANVPSEPFLREPASNDILDHQQERADLIIMIAATPGVSAEAMEISFATETRRIRNKDKMLVYMPDEYRQGFIFRRLRERGAKIHPLPLDDFSAEKCSKVVKRAVEDAMAFGLEKRRREAMQKSDFKPTIGIVTALHPELKAALQILDDPTVPSTPGKSAAHQEYYHGTIAAANGGSHDVVVALIDKGNNSAAARTTLLLEEYPSIQSVLMVGIAGGVPYPQKPASHVWLGDVVVSDENGVIQYDNVKAYRRGVHRVPPPRPPSGAWLHRVKNYLATQPQHPKYWSYLDEILVRTGARRPRYGPLVDCPWAKDKKPIKQPPPPTRGRPALHVGPIGSANTVLKTASLRDKLREDFGIRAVEMEGSGIADATIIQGKAFLIVRGICDFANDSKNKTWQPYAAAAAAAFAKELIQGMPAAADQQL